MRRDKEDIYERWIGEGNPKHLASSAYKRDMNEIRGKMEICMICFRKQKALPSTQICGWRVSLNKVPT